MLAACGDDDSDFASRPDGKESSSTTPSSKVVEPAEVTTGTMTDSRDGQTYKTVTIGSQTWMAENINYETDSSFCYGDTLANCTKYGRLYTWEVATTVCPDGWHLPTKAEFETLFTAAGGKSTAGKVLKSTSGWNSGGNGSDAFAFSALPAGSKGNYGDCNYEGDNAYFWSSTEYYGNIAYDMNLFYNYDAAHLYNYYKYYGFSVRCLRDEGTTPQSSSSTKISSSSDTPESSSSEAKLSSSSVTPQSSSSEKAESSSSKVTEPAEVTTETMTDSRDGQTYRTVTIGTQTWMAENLNYETENSYCYGDDASNCTKYGRLYTWAAAMDSAGTWSTNGKGCGYNKTCSPTYPVRGVCPEGWHLPTRTEWNTLFTAVDGSSTAGTKLKSTSGWNSSGNGTDAYSFSALPAGLRDGNGNCNDEGKFTYFWSSTADNSDFAYFMYLYYSNGDAYLNYDYKGNGFSVRCLKD